jgi:hypothetical protein
MTVDGAQINRPACPRYRRPGLELKAYPHMPRHASGIRGGLPEPHPTGYQGDQLQLGEPPCHSWPCPGSQGQSDDTNEFSQSFGRIASDP